MKNELILGGYIIGGILYLFFMLYLILAWRDSIKLNKELNRQLAENTEL